MTRQLQLECNVTSSAAFLVWCIEKHLIMDSSLRWNDKSLSGYHVEHIDYSFVILAYARIHYPCHSGLDPESILEQRFHLWIPVYTGMTRQLQLECNVTSSATFLGVVYREAIYTFEQQGLVS